MISISELPSINAALNSISAILLVAGYLMIRRRKILYHKIFMCSAFLTSILFFVSYLTYHYYHGSTPFTGTGIVRAVYFTILISHTLLAVCVPVLAVITLFRAARGRFDKHKRIARWTLPVWLYVSVTGVIIYLLLY